MWETGRAQTIGYLPGPFSRSQLSTSESPAQRAASGALFRAVAWRSRRTSQGVCRKSPRVEGLVPGGGIDCPQQAVPATVDIHPLQNATSGVGVDHPVFAGTRPPLGRTRRERTRTLPDASLGRRRSRVQVSGIVRDNDRDALVEPNGHGAVGQLPPANSPMQFYERELVRQNSGILATRRNPSDDRKRRGGGRGKGATSSHAPVAFIRGARNDDRREIERTVERSNQRFRFLRICRKRIAHPRGHVPIDYQSWRCVLHSIACGTNCGGDGRIAVSDETGGDPPGQHDSDDDACDPAAEGGFQGLTSCWITTRQIMRRTHAILAHRR